MSVTNWARALVGSWALNVLGFFLIFATVSLLAKGIQSAAEFLAAAASHGVAVAFVVFVGIAWSVALSRIRPKHVRNSQDEIVPGAVLGFVTAAAFVWVYVFAMLSYLLMTIGAVEYHIVGGPDSTLPDLADAYLWHLLDLVPALGINKALGWSADDYLNVGRRGVI